MSHDPMSHEEAAKNQMVERFALGELRGNDRERFEAHFFDCPECFDEVQLTSEFLRDARSVLSREPEKIWLSRMTADLWRPAPALVSVLFLFAMGAAAYQNYKIDALRKPKIESRYFLGKQTRAPQGEKVIRARKDVPVSLKLELDQALDQANEFKSYQVQITNDSGKVKYSIPLDPQVDPQEDDYSVSVVLSPKVFKEGKYHVAIFGNQRAGSPKDIGGGSFYLQFAN